MGNSSFENQVVNVPVFLFPLIPVSYLPYHTCYLKPSFPHLQMHAETRAKDTVLLSSNYTYSNDRGFSFERNFVLHWWESETLIKIDTSVLFYCYMYSIHMYRLTVLLKGTVQHYCYQCYQSVIFSLQHLQSCLTIEQ